MPAPAIRKAYEMNPDGSLGRELDASDPRVRHLRNLHVDEVSLVDRPANPHARMLIVKSDEPSPEVQRRAAEIAAQLRKSCGIEDDRRVEKSFEQGAHRILTMIEKAQRDTGAAVSEHDNAGLERLHKQHLGAVVVGAPAGTGSLRQAVRERYGAAAEPEAEAVEKGGGGRLVAHVRRQREADEKRRQALRRAVAPRRGHC